MRCYLYIELWENWRLVKLRRHFTLYAKTDATIPVGMKKNAIALKAALNKSLCCTVGVSSGFVTT